MSPDAQDWSDVQERLLAGDRGAFLEVSRLVTRFLQKLRAYDFQDEWDDLRQEVLISIVQNARAGRLRDADAFVGYVRIITRNKFVDRLKRRFRFHEKETLPWGDVCEEAVAREVTGEDDAADVWVEVARLPEDQQKLVIGIYREGKTYQELADEIGVPLGSTKRKLREALDVLRSRFARDGSSGSDDRGF